MTHCTNEQLQLLSDGRLEGAEGASVRRHLQECEPCAFAYRRLDQISRALKELPLQPASEHLTEKVMAQVLAGTRPSLLFRFVENLAYAFAILLVIGIMAVVFILTGVIDLGQVSRSASVADSYWSTSSTWMNSAMMSVSAWLTRYFPIRGNLGTAGALLAVMGMLALIDKAVGRRLMGRKLQSAAER